MKTTKTGIAATALAALALGACNDSGFVLEQEGGANNVSVLEGAYGGFLSGAHTEYYRLLQVGTEAWLAYGINSNLEGFQATGFFRADGTILDKTYTGTSAVEYFGESPAGTGTSTAVYNDAVQPPLLNGSFVIGANTSGFSAGPIAGANFDYRAQARLTSLDGSWIVTDLNGNSHTLVVDGLDGTFTLDAGDPCAATGVFTALENRNAYEGVITFNNACPANVQNKTLNGVALIYANQTPVGTQLIAMFRDRTSDSVGYVLNGVR
jgi:hypothetical protein